MHALIFVISAFTDLYLFLLLLRFWMPWVHADFRNPVAQAVLKLSSPLVVPTRRLVPSIGRLDSATVLVAFVLQALVIVAILALLGHIAMTSASVMAIAITALVDLCILSVRLFVFAVIVQIVLSWFAPHTHNPMTALVNRFAEPVLRPFRRFLPPMGGFDISPVFAVILLVAATMLLNELRPIGI